MMNFSFSYEWLEKELSDKTCTSKQLQWVLDALQSMSNWSLHPEKGYFDENIRENLNSIGNPKLLQIIKEIMKFLVKQKFTAQNIWNSMLQLDEVLSWLSVSTVEILGLAASNGAQPSDEDMQQILDFFPAMTRDDKFTAAFLKMLAPLCVRLNFKCNFDFLTDTFLISKDVVESSMSVVKRMYKTLEICAQNGSLIEVFLFMVQEKEFIFQLPEDLFETFPSNWLKRTPLHLAVMLLDDHKLLKLIPHCIVQKYLNIQDIHGCTPLHLAYLHENENAVDFLITQGANKDIMDRFGVTPKAFRCNDDPGK